MSIVSCPRCGDKVSVPPAASPSALVQCPLCCEEYFLSDALIQLPPMLRVVGSHAAGAEKEADYHLAEPVTAAIAGAEFDASSAGVATVSPRPQLRTVSRGRRQERSAVGEIIKVVLGGAAGLLGGLLVLWWGFGVDVGDLAPKISKVQYLRFLVPVKLRDNSTPGQTVPAEFDTLDAQAPQGNGQASGKPTKGNGATTDSGEPGPEDTARDGEPIKSSKAKGKSDDEALLTLDPLGLEGKSTPAQDIDLNIGAPLKEVTPKKGEKESQGPDSKSETPSDDAPGTGEKKSDESAPSKPAKEKKKTEPSQPQDAPGEPAQASEKPPEKEPSSKPQEPQPE